MRLNKGAGRYQATQGLAGPGKGLGGKGEILNRLSATSLLQPEMTVAAACRAVMEESLSRNRETR